MEPPQQDQRSRDSPQREGGNCSKVKGMKDDGPSKVDRLDKYSKSKGGGVAGAKVKDNESTKSDSRSDGERDSAEVSKGRERSRSASRSRSHSRSSQSSAHSDDHREIKPDAEAKDTSSPPENEEAVSSEKGLLSQLPPELVNSNSLSAVLTVRHLSRNVNKAHISELFNVFGSVKNVYCVGGKQGNVANAAAFIEMEDEKGAREVHKHLNRAQLDGRIIQVEFYEPGKESAAPPDEDDMQFRQQDDDVSILKQDIARLKEVDRDRNSQERLHNRERESRQTARPPPPGYHGKSFMGRDQDRDGRWPQRGCGDQRRDPRGYGGDYRRDSRDHRMNGDNGRFGGGGTRDRDGHDYQGADEGFRRGRIDPYDDRAGGRRRPFDNRESRDRKMDGPPPGRWRASPYGGDRDRREHPERPVGGTSGGKGRSEPEGRGRVDRRRSRSRSKSGSDSSKSSSRSSTGSSRSSGRKNPTKQGRRSPVKERTISKRVTPRGRGESNERKGSPPRRGPVTKKPEVKGAKGRPRSSSSSRSGSSSSSDSSSPRNVRGGRDARGVPRKRGGKRGGPSKPRSRSRSRDRGGKESGGRKNPTSKDRPRSRRSRSSSSGSYSSSASGSSRSPSPIRNRRGAGGRGRPRGRAGARGGRGRSSSSSGSR